MTKHSKRKSSRMSRSNAARAELAKTPPKGNVTPPGEVQLNLKLKEGVQRKPPAAPRATRILINQCMRYVKQHDISASMLHRASDIPVNTCTRLVKGEAISYLKAKTVAAMTAYMATVTPPAPPKEPAPPKGGMALPPVRPAYSAPLPSIGNDNLQVLIGVRTALRNKTPVNQDTVRTMLLMLDADHNEKNRLKATIERLESEMALKDSHVRASASQWNVLDKLRNEREALRAALHALTAP